MSPLSSADPGAGPTELFLLALIQGVAEFLPISSSGHLVLARVALDVREAGLALDVALHVGTLLAVVLAYRRDLAAIVRDLARGRARLLAWLVVATVPAGLAGLLIDEWIATVFQTARSAAVGLLATAAILLAGEWARARGGLRPAEAASGVPARLRSERAPTFSDALLIGTAQALALVPGISRSGTTISAGLACGFSPEGAARLSFLMAIPAILGAAVLELPGAFREGFGELDAWLVVVAAAFAGLVGWACLRVLLLVLRRGAFRWFALYCAIVGGTVLAVA